jgi:Domain of unknown function (DUF5664)
MARFDLIAPMPLKKLAEHLGRGAAKYGDRNWERGYPWSLSYAALQRHLNAFWDGENYDPEFPESHHLDAAMFHVMALRDFAQKFPEYDDRPGSNVPKTVQEMTTEELEAAVDETFRASGFNPATVIKPPKSQRATNHGRDSEVQTSRWEVP